MDFDRCLSSNNRYYDSSWYQYPPQSHHTMYPIRDQQDYPSPAPSDPSPGPRPHQQLDHAALYSDSTMPPPFTQIESSIGPTRVTRTRQASLKLSALGRRSSLSTNYIREQDTVLHSPVQMPDNLLSRADSPSNDRYGDRSSLHGASPHLPPVQLSPYHPGTPTSMTSPYSPYEHARRSRTRSNSNFDGRAHSPALSTNSARTSHSSQGLGETSARGRDGASSVSVSAAAAAPRLKEKEKHHKHRLRDVDRKNICLYHMRNPNARQEDIGSAFGVERSTISKILKDKERWLNISEEDESNEQTSKHRPSKFPEVEEEMMKSLQAWTDSRTNITDHIIRQRALDIAKALHIPPDKFKGSSGWIENFKHRHDIRRGEWLKANKAMPLSLSLPPARYLTGTDENELSAAAAVVVAAAAGVPPTPVLMPYDQRQQRLEAANANDSASQGSRLPPPPWEQDTGTSHQQQTGHSMHIDPSLRPSDSLLESQQHHARHEHQHQPHHLHEHQQPLDPIQHSPTVSYFPPPQQQAQPPVLYGPGVNPPPPTIDQADEAMNVVIAYLDTAGQGLLKIEERQLLTTIKCALFQHASGLPYERP